MVVELNITIRCPVQAPVNCLEKKFRRVRYSEEYAQGSSLRTKLGFLLLQTYSSVFLIYIIILLITKIQNIFHNTKYLIINNLRI